MTDTEAMAVGQRLQEEFRQELRAIADWWVNYAQDHERGGFYGEVDQHNRPVENASKGVILNARILWFFSAVAKEVDNPAYHQCADRAFYYLRDYFFDRECRGVYWELNAAGEPINTKKQVYAQAFAIYALTAYYQLTQRKQALDLAMECFELLEQHAIDRQNQGYLEAFTQRWGVLEDLRLSEKDLNFPKSQNTHLHVLEAYTNLYQVQPTEKIRTALAYNIDLFDRYMIDTSTHHLRMFMDLDWRDHSPGFTYGHDIEAVWLIAKALDALDDENYRRLLMPKLLQVAQVNLQEARGSQGQVIDSYDFSSKTKNTQAVWWVQAEALVGYLFAFTASGDFAYLQAVERVWAFINTHQIDQQRGEWLWLSREDTSTPAYPEAPPGDSAAAPNYKAGFWKCPYHNGRAMIEAGRYLQALS